MRAGIQAVMPDLDEAGRQHVLHEAREELNRVNGRRLAIAGSEGDELGGDVDEPAVGDGDAMGVAPEVAQHVVGAAEWPLGVGDPIDRPKLAHESVEAFRIAEVVEAVKQHRGAESFYSKTRAKIFYTVFSRLAGYNLQGASDFKLMDRRVLQAWRRLGEHNLFFRGMSAWLGFKRVQLPFNVPERIGGASNWSALQLTRLAMTAVTSFSSAPLQLITLTGAAFAVFAMALGVQTVYLKIAGRAVDGFTVVQHSFCNFPNH